MLEYKLKYETKNRVFVTDDCVLIVTILICLPINCQIKLNPIHIKCFSHLFLRSFQLVLVIKMVIYRNHLILLHFLQIVQK
ncbi:Uncharacterised protein [Porphyromonas macacae]|uniref:Uncharacterized protein n=1 Tax=Porphyromonas macacae TaxID=28115 RepID=A0A379DHN2_9PORP|nr:Uncharacterised protein [Porphyromonas macacae]